MWRISQYGVGRGTVTIKANPKQRFDRLLPRRCWPADDRFTFGGRNVHRQELAPGDYTVTVGCTEPDSGELSGRRPSATPKTGASARVHELGARSKLFCIDQSRSIRAHRLRAWNDSRCLPVDMGQVALVQRRKCAEPTGDCPLLRSPRSNAGLYPCLRAVLKLVFLRCVESALQ